MPRKRKAKPWTLADNLYQPVSKRKVYVDPKPYEIPGRYGVQWEYMGEGLSPRAPYDADSMAHVRKMGGMKALIDKVCPGLHPARKAQLLERMNSISHAKQRAALLEHIKDKGAAHDKSGASLALLKLKAMLRRK
jgi:hypothetical protein